MTETIKAAFFDIDGTLYSHRTHKVPESTVSALKALRKLGIRLVTATGRYPGEMENLPIYDLGFEAFITLNGQLCYDSTGEVFYENPIADSNTIGALFDEKSIPLLIINHSSSYINFIDENVLSISGTITAPIPSIGIYNGEKILQAVAYVDHERESALLSNLRNVNITRWHPYGVDIVASGGSKASGILRYLSLNSIPPEDTIAFGDGENDIEMLKAARIGVAMGNSNDSVKQAADFITKDIDDNGIAYALRYYGMI